MTGNVTSLIYDQMIAGRFPSTAMDAERAVFYMATAALDTEAVQVVWSFKDGFVSYLAIPAKLAASGVVTTQMACALPGMPEHKGNGIYRLDLSVTVAVVVCTDDRLDYLYHDSDAIDGYLEQYKGLPVVDVGPAPHVELSPAVVGARREMRRTLARLARTNMLAASAAAVLFTFAMVGVSFMNRSSGVNTSNVRNELVRTVDELVLQNKLADQMEELMRVSATATRAGGWIKDYRLMKDGKAAFVVVLPEWVTHDYVESLGKGVIGDIDRSKGVVEFKKGDLNAPAGK